MYGNRSPGASPGQRPVAPAVGPIDPLDRLGDVEARFRTMDRLSLRVSDALDVLSVEAAPHLGQAARDRLVAAREDQDEALFELVDLGLSLLALRDVLDAGPRP